MSTRWACKNARKEEWGGRGTGCKVRSCKIDTAHNCEKSPLQKYNMLRLQSHMTFCKHTFTCHCKHKRPPPSSPSLLFSRSDLSDAHRRSIRDHKSAVELSNVAQWPVDSEFIRAVRIRGLVGWMEGERARKRESTRERERARRERARERASESKRERERKREKDRGGKSAP